MAHGWLDPSTAAIFCSHLRLSSYPPSRWMQLFFHGLLALSAEAMERPVWSHQPLIHCGIAQQHEQPHAAAGAKACHPSGCACCLDVKPLPNGLSVLSDPSWFFSAVDSHRLCVVFTITPRSTQRQQPNEHPSSFFTF